jgi:hypothetical protein
LPVPGEEIGDLPGRVIGDAGEQIGQVELRVEAVELGALDQGIERRGAPAAGVGAGEEIILAADRDAAQGPLGGFLSRARRPSSKHRTSPFQRERIWRSALASSDLRESLGRVASPQARNASAIGFERFWRSLRRCSGGEPVIVLSIW